MQPHLQRSQAGFTLVELIVVVAVLAILALVGLPNLLNGRISANEASVVQTMRSVSSAEATVKQMSAIDNESDGAGEYAYLAEMTGTANLRGSGSELTVPVLSGKLGQVQGGIVTANGYHYALYIPDVDGAGVPEDADGGKDDETEVDVDLAERHWMVYAWPVNKSNSGNSAFVINESGEILRSDNLGAGQLYSGPISPDFDAATLLPGDMTQGMVREGQFANDGGRWIPIR